MVLHRDDKIRTLGKKQRGCSVDRFGESRVDHRHIIAKVRELLGTFHGHGVEVAQTKNSDPASPLLIVEMLDDLRFAHLQKFRLLLDLHAFGRPSWIADESGMLDVGGCEHHVDQLILVFRSHGDDIWDTPEIGDIKKTMMGWAILR